jgi:hypothetical protein
MDGGECFVSTSLVGWLRFPSVGFQDVCYSVDVAPLQLLLPFGRIGKTKAMSAPQKSFFGVWIIPNVFFIYLFC